MKWPLFWNFVPSPPGCVADVLVSLTPPDVKGDVAVSVFLSLPEMLLIKNPPES